MSNGKHRTRRPAELPFDDREICRRRHGLGVRTGADAAGGEISAGANVGLGDGEGTGCGTCAAPCTDDHNRPYHGCDARACAAAADADAAGVGDNVT